MLPSYWPEKAIQRPSGLKAASVSAPSELVSRTALPPSRPTFHRSLAWVKTMCVALTSGWRRKRVPWAWVGVGVASRAVMAANSAAAGHAEVMRSGV